MDKTRIVLGGILFLSNLLVYVLFAQSSILQLSDCIDLSLRNNLEVRRAELAKEHTKFLTKSYISRALPKIVFNGSYNYALELPISLLPRSITGGRADDFFEVQMGVPQSIVGTLSLEQPIYNHATFIGLRAIKPSKELASLQMELTKESIVYNVSATYYNIQILELTHQLLVENQHNIEQLQKSLDVMYANQLIPKKEVLQLEMQALNLSNRLERTRVDTKRLYNLLKFLMGMPLSEELYIEPAKTSELSKADFSTAPHKESSNRLEVKILSKQIDLLKIDKLVSLAPYIPTISFKAAYGISGNNTRFNPVETIQDKWFTNSMIGLNIRIPIFDALQGLWNRKIKSNEIEQQKNKLRQLKQSIAKDMQASYDDYQMQKTIEISSKRIFTLAQTIYHQELGRYQEGLSILSVLLKAQDAMNEARNNYIGSLIQLKKSELEYQRQLGVLMQ